jgi:hypothetical protein
MSFLIATGCFRPEVTSEADAQPRFSIRVLLTFSVYFAPFQRYKRFRLAEIGGITIAAATGGTRPEMTSPVDSLASCWFTLTVGIFRLFDTVQKLVDVFDFHAKCP